MIMNLRKFTFILTLLIAACLQAFSQTDTISVQTIIAKTGKFNSEHPVEKVYLHFDKPYYAVGDTIWFKAYITIDVHQPSLLSKVVYVDVLNSKDSLVKKMKLPVTGSTALGDITLNKTFFKQGNYHIRAYTNYMRNFDPAYFFNKTITLGTSLDKDVFTNISLTAAVKNNTTKVDAGIHYSTTDGRAYTGKRVNWKVQNSDDETLFKGRVTTDNMGNAVISFTTNKPDAINSAVLITGIDLDSKTVNQSFSLKHAASPMDVQFFPEGGDLINGIQSRVAFKAIKPDGLGIDVKGSVTDNTGTVVAAITTRHLGMGVFDLLPVAGKTYKAVVTFPDGSQNTYELPKAKSDGMTFSVSNADPEKINITFSASDAFFQANKYKMISILAQNGQVICYGAQSPLVKKVYTGSIAKSKITTGTGVTKFTLFASNGEVLAERVIFIQRNDLLNINLHTAKTTYSPRQKVTVDVLAKNADQPSEANLSVTVLDETKVPFDENAETTILTSLLLTSDLKGYIEKPNYYFNHVNAKANADLDVLMLTQGYTHFLYKDVLANKIPPIKYLPEDGIEIAGTLRTSNGMPISKGYVNFAIKDKHILAHTTTNQLGEFKFKLSFPDSVYAVIDAKGNYNSNNLLIIVNSAEYQHPTPNYATPDEVTNIDTAFAAYLKNNKQQALNSHVLKEVVINEAAPERKPHHEDYTALIGLSGFADQEISGAALAGCISLYECLKTMTNAFIYDDGDLYIKRGHNTGDKSTPVAIYYNGLPVDYNFLSGLNAADIESVEVFTSDGYSGVNKASGTKGILVINGKKVKKNHMTQEQIREVIASMQNSSISLTPMGYTMARAFYNPKYDVSGNAPMGGDLRTTIYWNPKVVTDKNGVTSFDYFNADGKGTYRAIIEGIDSNGNIGRTVYRYKVE
jgi:hypothetical protein